MPTLFRLLTATAIIGLCVAVVIVLLATLVTPDLREIRAPVKLPPRPAGVVAPVAAPEAAPPAATDPQPHASGGDTDGR